MNPDPRTQAARARLAWTLLMLAPALWSANMLVARWSAEWFPPHALAFWRWLVALVPMLAICGAVPWRRRQEVVREWRDLLLLGEAIRGYHLAGAALVLGGVWLASRRAAGAV